MIRALYVGAVSMETGPVQLLRLQDQHCGMNFLNFLGSDTWNPSRLESIVIYRCNYNRHARKHGKYWEVTTSWARSQSVGCGKSACRQSQRKESPVGQLLEHSPKNYWGSTSNKIIGFRRRWLHRDNKAKLHCKLYWGRKCSFAPSTIWHCILLVNENMSKIQV